MALNPLHQFQINQIGTINVGAVEIAFTNQALWMLGAVGVVLLIFILGARKKAMVPGRLQAFVELTFDFVKSLVRDTSGEEGLKYLPLIMSVFLFIAAINVSGMIPGSFTSTSQIYMTGAMALALFIIVVGIGFARHGFKFFGMFFPHGTPVYLAPLIIPLEIISFLARPFTLAIRLCANMVAGHVLLKLFATFAIMLLGWFSITAALPFVLLIALSGLELFVALLQAYIFTVLTCVYLNDSLHMH